MPLQFLGLYFILCLPTFVIVSFEFPRTPMHDAAPAQINHICFTRSWCC